MTVLKEYDCHNLKVGHLANLKDNLETYDAIVTTPKKFLDFY